MDSHARHDMQKSILETTMQFRQIHEITKKIVENMDTKDDIRQFKNDFKGHMENGPIGQSILYENLEVVEITQDVEVFEAFESVQQNLDVQMASLSPQLEVKNDVYSESEFETLNIPMPLHGVHDSVLRGHE